MLNLVFLPQSTQFFHYMAYIKFATTCAREAFGLGDLLWQYKTLNQYAEREAQEPPRRS